MIRHYGGEKSTRGVYLNLSTWEFVQLYNEPFKLPGDAGASYLKVPAIFTVIAGPAAGLVFIIFLPFIGIVGFAGFLGYKAWQWSSLLVRKAFQPAAVEWKPGEAYLTKGGKGKKPEAEKELSQLEQEIKKKKEQEKQ